MLYQTKNPHGGDVYGRTIVLDYSSNTNPFGTPPGVVHAMEQALTQVEHYPDPYCRALVNAIAAHEGAAEAQILCGNGAAELIYSYCEALKPRTAVELAPTFSEYSLGLERVGCRITRYPLVKENGFLLTPAFLPFLEEEKPDVLFLCNPNNPTGQMIAPALLQQILQTCHENHIHLFLDECFLDLSDEGESLSGSLTEVPELFILKAFTKNYGMAGVRLGYCLTADSVLLAAMAQMVQPWNVSSIAQAAGIAALQEHAFLEKTKAFLPAERCRMHHALEQLGLWVCPGHANYLLFEGPLHLAETLLEQGISIRDCSNYHGLQAGWYRVAVRRREQNEQLLSAIALACGRK